MWSRAAQRDEDKQLLRDTHSAPERDEGPDAPPPPQLRPLRPEKVQEGLKEIDPGPTHLFQTLVESPETIWRSPQEESPKKAAGSSSAGSFLGSLSLVLKPANLNHKKPHNSSVQQR